MIKKYLLALTIIFTSINASAITPLTCSQYYNAGYFGTLTASDTPVPYVITFTSLATPSNARPFNFYVPTMGFGNGLTSSTCIQNPDGSLTEEADSAYDNHMVYVAVMYPSSPGVWNVVKSNFPMMANHNYVGKLRSWNPDFSD